MTVLQQTILDVAARLVAVVNILISDDPLIRVLFTVLLVAGVILDARRLYWLRRYADELANLLDPSRPDH